jgi:hypothetical protein
MFDPDETGDGSAAKTTPQENSIAIPNLAVAPTFSFFGPITGQPPFILSV